MKKIKITKNALAFGQRFVAGEVVVADDKTADTLIAAELAVLVEEPAADKPDEPTADNAEEPAADKPKRGRKKKDGAQK